MKTRIGIFVIAPLTLACTAYNLGGSGYNRVCVQKDTQTRVADRNCQVAHSLIYRWWYLPSANAVPRTGSRVNGGSAIEPHDVVVHDNVPAEGVHPVEVHPVEVHVAG